MFSRVREREDLQFFAALREAHRPLATAWWALVVLRGVMPALFSVAIGGLVASVGHEGLGIALAAVGVVFVISQVLAPLHGQVGTSLGSHVSSWLNDRLMDATVAPPGTAHLESAELSDDLTAARDFELGLTGPPMSLAMGFIAEGLIELVAGLGQVLLLFGYHWWAAVLVGAAWASTHWLLRKSTVWDRATGEVQEAQRHAEYSYRLAMDAPAAKELRVFGLSEWTVARFTRSRRLLVDRRFESTRLRRGPLAAAIGLLVVVNGLVFWRLAADAAAGAVGLAQVVVFVQAAIGAGALAFGGLNWALPHAAGAVAAMRKVHDRMAEVGALPAGDRPATGMPAGKLRFRNVGFRYSPDGKPVLDGLDLTVPAGSSLAVVGVNGAGKTTLVKLLCRLYDPTEGAIEVDGVDLRELDVAGWRERITAVFQDYVRYEWPLRDNVAPGGGSDEDVVAALELAGAGHFAGLDTILATGYDGGTDLSGGQWQRVALARALHAVGAGAGVVVLDEPTAQLDVRGEAEIFERILAATRECTTILISHRFSTVRHVDRICVLEDGKVVELGSHDELMALGGRYRTMFDLQASRFEEEPDGLALN
ncbi:ABC transporter ATP-binding protein [Kutzneria buriramensis]|uniref:ABC transporter ATP-binding protein n=1 Tax=Kutzneria buriramensis TaxID=1045776 RepID=UPI000E27C3F6|nr:ABC transporter ATP-binding protein [Kutzneria buriramensis]